MNDSGKDSFDDKVVFRVAELFLAKRSERVSTLKIAEQVNREYPRSRELTRESIYPVLSEAVSRGFLRLVPPIDQQLTAKLIAAYPTIPRDSLHVVPTVGRDDNPKVSAVAAGLALDVIKEIARATSPHSVGIGLGPGRATLDFCQELSRLLISCPDPIKLKLVAISAGCPSEEPEYASISFFNLFPKPLVVSKVGLFAETLVPQRDFDQIKQRPGVKEAFDARQDIDVVVTSMGDVRDDHDLLSMFLHQAGVDLKRLRAKGWVGNVQYRPYSNEAPIMAAADELRAVTLFELEDLVRISNQKLKHVILIARQCGICGRTRAEALRPLLLNPSMRVFSTLVLDTVTATELLKVG